MLETPVHVSDNVRSNEYEPFWTHPRRVDKLLNNSTVSLNDGAIRNSKNLVPVQVEPPQIEECVLPSQIAQLSDIPTETKKPAPKLYLVTAY